MLFQKILESSFSSKFSTVSYSQKVYAALCNNCVEDHDEDTEYTLSWREAAGLVADIRNNLFDLEEQYIDWYCSGSGLMDEEEFCAEGFIDQEILEDFQSIGVYLGD